jgi:hypothetical protein
MGFQGFELYTIVDRDGIFFDFEYEAWEDQLSGTCLVPTYDIAFKKMSEFPSEWELRVQKVKIPQEETEYTLEDVHLPCQLSEDEDVI